jgi:hypothetical protein
MPDERYDAVIRTLVRAFETVGVDYLIGGSVASSAHGVLRYTQDIDFVVNLERRHVEPLTRMLADKFYVDPEMLIDAIETLESTNVLHLGTMVKADLFIKRDDAFAESEWARKRTINLGSGDAPLSVNVASPEDTILQKLIWYRLGGGVSDRQWRDVAGVIEVQAESLDLEYIRGWASKLGLSDLFERAYADAFNTGPGSPDKRKGS